ncbi:MAG: hypothetical protein M4579_003488 [Chaenotheca gracillima]|nr:MAG: hypothetical protein M4579_003488 [Chaenotheca gracillima]
MYATRAPSSSRARVNQGQGDQGSSRSLEKRTQRTTRSQSRELGEDKPIQGGRGKARQTGRQPLVENNERPTAHAGRENTLRGRVQLESQAKGLSPVTERHEDVRYPNLQAGDDRRSSSRRTIVAQAGSPNAARLSGASSNISGTTAVTADLNEKPWHFSDIDCDLDDVTQALPELSLAADKLINFLCSGLSSSDVVAAAKQLHESGSKSSKQFKRLHGHFGHFRQQCGKQDYIDWPELVKPMYSVRSLLEVPSRNSRPDIILQKANLATFASLIVAPSCHSENIYRTLQIVDQKFPALFASGFSNEDLNASLSGTSNLLDETLALALEIRTQMVISCYFAEPGNNVEEILKRFFLDHEKPPSSRRASFAQLLDHDHLKGWPLETLDDGRLELPSSFTEKIVKRARQILSFVQKDVSADRTTTRTTFDIDGLEKSFPWLEFLAKLIDWTQLRFGEINNQIDSRGGVETIKGLLEKDIEVNWSESREKEDKNPIPRTMPNIAPEDLQKLFGTRQAASRLRQRESARRESLRRESAHFSPAQDPQASGSPRHSHFTGSELTLKPPAQGKAPASKARRIEVDVARSTSAAADVPKAQQEAPAEDEWRPQNLEDEERDGAEDPHQSTVDAITKPIMSVEEVVQRYHRQQREKNKENVHKGQNGRKAPQRKRFFNETQDDRERVEPISEHEDEPPTRRQGPAQESRKRPRAEDADAADDSPDSSGDENFQNDRRAIDPDRRQAAPVNPRRVVFGAGLSLEERNSGSAIETPSANLVDSRDDLQHKEASTLNNDNSEMSPPVSADPNVIPRLNYAHINRLAKRRVAMHAPRRTQTRRPWSEESCLRLIEIIENDEFHTSWSKIEALEDPLLEGRTQVQLKDKARNLKLDFLKAGSPLPHNFEPVTLKQSDRQKLKDMDIRIPEGA